MTALELPDNWYPVLSSVSRHKDCSECVMIDPDGESGIARVVSDPDYMVEIGQSEDHKAARREQEERRAFGTETLSLGVDDAF